MSELEEIANFLEGSEINLDDAMQKYEHGIKIAQELQVYLKNAENKVETLKQGFDK